MDGQLRKMAACHAKAYREYKEYLRGYEEGRATGGVRSAADGEALERKIRLRRGWVAAVDTVRSRLEETEPEKARVFERLFGLEEGHRYKDNRVIQLSMELCTSPANIYRWRESILDQLILAATQQGLIKPFEE